MKNSTYWEKRVANKTWDIYNNLEKRNKALMEIYQEASLDIEEELFQIAKKIKTSTPTLSDMHKYNRLGKLKDNINNTIKQLGKEVEKRTTKQITQAFMDNYSNNIKELGEEYSLPNKKLTESLLKFPWSGENFSNRLWENSRVLERNLNEIMVRGLVQGKTIVEMATELQSRMMKGFDEAHRLVRTETMHYLNESSLRAYMDSGIKEVQFWTAIDERTCPVCGVKHGNKYRLKDAPVLPLHANCRCTYLPVIDAEEDIKESEKVEGLWKEFEVKYKQFSSKKEIVNYIKNEYGLTFSDSRKYPISKELLQDSVNWLDKFSNKFKGFEKINPVKLPTFKIKAGIKPVGYYSYYTNKPEAIELVLNGLYFTDKKYNIDYITRCKNSGWTVPNAQGHKTFVHEYGHHVANSLKWLDIQNDLYKGNDWCKDFINEVIKDYNIQYNKNISFKDISKIVSEYGGTKPAEAFAETFAEYFGGEEPREFARIFGEKVESKLTNYIKKGVE